MQTVLGSRTIQYVLDIPENNNGAGIIILPGASGGVLDIRYGVFAKAFAAKGFTCIRANLWQDSSELDGFSIDQLLKESSDLVALLKQRCKRIFVFSKSFSSVLALFLDSDGVVIVSPAIRLGASLDEIRFSKLKDVELNSLCSSFEELSKVKVPVFMIQGTEDKLVSYSNAVSLTDAIADSELLLVDGADHSFKSYEQELILQILAFFDRLNPKPL